MSFVAAARSRPRWLWSAAVLLALGCGNLKRSPYELSDSSGGDSNGDTSASGTASGARSAGGAQNGTGGTTGGVVLVIPTAGTPNDTPGGPAGGGRGEGGQPDYPAKVELCIYPVDIPAEWSASGEVDANGCEIGVLGVFNFMGCYYELIDTTPRDVDPFTSGHSHCCYKSQLEGCK